MDVLIRALAYDFLLFAKVPPTLIDLRFTHSFNEVRVNNLTLDCAMRSRF
jgi:hypothetical protein